MTQKADIFSFLLKNPNLRPIEIAKSLGFPAPSVRRVLHTLRQSNIVSLPKKDFTSRILSTRQAGDFNVKIQQAKIEPVIIKKKYILNTVMYCSSKPKTMKATTYSDKVFTNRDIMNLMNSMIEKISEETINDCSEIAYDSGLDITDVKSMPFEFPEIRTGILIQISKVALENFS